MTEFATYTTDTAVNVRAPGAPVREVQLGETLQIRSLPGFAVVSLELVSHPGTPPTVSDLDVTPQVRGLHHFRVIGANGRTDLYIYAYDADCLARVRSAPPNRGRTAPLTSAEKRLVIRAICQAHASDARWWDGSAASLVSRNLSVFGG